MVEKDAERAGDSEENGQRERKTFRAWWEDSGNRDITSHSARAQKPRLQFILKTTVKRG
jgi:hypothetical protein